MKQSRYRIEEPFEMPGYGLSNQIYRFSVEDIQFWGIFSSGDTLDSEEIYVIREHTAGALALDENATTFKFDRSLNIEAALRDEGEAGELYNASHLPNLSAAQMNAVGEAIVKCFELHHKSTEARQYYALALDTRLARFYTRLAKRHCARLGFKAFTGIGSDKLGFAFEKEV